MAKGGLSAIAAGQVRVRGRAVVRPRPTVLGMNPRRLLPDLTPFRGSRPLQLLVGGGFITGLGSQATLVALPYQLYLATRSPLLVGLLGAVELGPLIIMSLYAGALADRLDRRRLLLWAQTGVVGCTGGLAAIAATGHSTLALLYVLGGLLAGFNAVQQTARSAMLPKLVHDPALLGPALATNYGLSSLAQVVGPGLGGVLIAVVGAKGAYAADGLSSLLCFATVLPLAPQHGARPGAPTTATGRSILEGVRFVGGNRALLGSFAADLLAMTFGMPRALFAVLSITVYHAGASGTGLLYSAVAAGATVAAVLTGWIAHARRLGLITMCAIAAWGVAIAAAGLMNTIWLAAALLALAGAADSVSAVCRTTINQAVTPERYRGRMSSIFGIVVTSGPRLGDLESGTVAAAAGVEFSVVSGGLLCLVGLGVIAVAFPQLARYSTPERAPGPAATDPVG